MDFLQTIEVNRQKFVAFNSQKVARYQDLLPNINIRKALNALPFLLNVNHKKLPGYVEGLVPYGIVGYTPDPETEKFINAKFYGANIEYNNDEPFIEMLALIGSVGTVAYNKKSDFDYWVCVNKKKISKDELVLFQKKVDAVQQWVEKEIKLPVHLFVNDIDAIKLNIFAEDADEAFGSTIGALLKDEFYRSSIIVAGKVPFWWVLPHFVRDNDYNTFFERLPEDKKENDYIDLGNLYKISREDFLGAALFQIIKSLGNPFKSILKLGVLEKYLFEDKDSPLLSQKVKMSILQNKVNDVYLDGYLLMFTEVYNYYSETIEDKKLLEILKQNFYLKIDPQLSKYNNLQLKNNLPYNVQVMLKYVQNWGWTVQTIKDLDNFDNWDFNRVRLFWESVQRFMLTSYQKISTQFPQMNLQSKISDSDFKILSRKIKTHFSKEPDKIENFITFKDETFESILYIEPAIDGAKELEWQLYKSKTNDKGEFFKTLIRSEDDLLRLLIWTAINHVYDPEFTRLNIKSGYSRLDSNTVIQLLNAVVNHFTGKKMHVKNEYLVNPQFALQNMIIVNFNQDNAEEVNTIYHLSFTSWGEYFLKSYKTEEITQLLTIILNDGLQQHLRFNEFCLIYTPASYKKGLKSLIKLFQESYEFVVEKKSKGARRFIGCWLNKYIMVTQVAENVAVMPFDSIQQFYGTMSIKPAKVIDYNFLSESGRDIAALSFLYSVRKENEITVAYEENGKFVYIYTIDENKNYYINIKPLVQKESLFIFTFGFLLNTISRVKKNNQLSNLRDKGIRFYKLQGDRLDQFSVYDETERVSQLYYSKVSLFEGIYADAAKYQQGEVLYNIIFNDKSRMENVTIKELGAVAQRVKKDQLTGKKIFPALSVINFTDLKEKDKELGTTIYLLEKYKFELVLERLLCKI